MIDISECMPLLRYISLANGPVGASTLCNIPTLNISQATIGRQLATLEKAGILKKVSNKGRVLTEYGLDTLRKMDINSSKNKIAQELVDLSFSSGQDALIDIMETRQLLEPYAAYNAALNATEANIVHIENLAFVHRYTLSRGEPANKEDLNFHLAIAKGCGNKALSKILDLLLTDDNAYVKFSKASDGQRELQVQYHLNILNNIKNHDAKAAENAMREHLHHVYLDVKESLAQKGSKK